MSKNGTLFLIPTTLGEGEPLLFLPNYTTEPIKSLSTFIVEDERSARRFLTKLSLQTPIQECALTAIGKHQSDASLEEIIAPLLSGTNVGLLSEAGCPGVADPGQKVIAAAQAHQVKVVPLIGPSSILLALMASGANGQKFTFHGYLPVDHKEREAELKRLELLAQQGYSQIFIEVPHRNNQMIESLLKICAAQTPLTIASNITQSDESIKTMAIGEWRKDPPEIKKIPTVFIFPAEPRT